MRRWVTWLVVVGLAALGLVAAVDVLRGGEERVSPSAVQTPGVSASADQLELAVRQLREAGVRGLLTYSDDECGLHAVSLPELDPAPAPAYEMCRPARSTGGLAAFDGDVVWSGLGYGTAQVILPKGKMSRGIRAWLGNPAGQTEAGFRAVQAVSLQQGRYVVLAESTYEPHERVLALVQGKRVVFAQPRWVVRDARFLRPSPGGAYFVGFGPEGPSWFDRNAVPRAFPAAVRNPRAVTWSPDEQWTALATAESVYVFRSDQPHERIVRIPLAVRDLDWESLTGSGAPQPTTHLRV